MSRLPPDARFAPELETHVYRVAQEALNNIAKHAAAHNVSVVLDSGPRGTMLIVEDDGRGFDFERARRRGSAMGVLGMFERAQLIGGKLEIESANGHGTAIYLHLPSVLPQHRTG
jgi:signal transduction histidine kinase